MTNKESLTRIKSYGDLTSGGEINIELTQDEACVALFIHDYGVTQLSDEERQVLYSLIAKIKDQVWP